MDDYEKKKDPLDYSIQANIHLERLKKEKEKAKTYEERNRI